MQYLGLVAKTKLEEFFVPDLINRYEKSKFRIRFCQKDKFKKVSVWVYAQNIGFVIQWDIGHLTFSKGHKKVTNATGTPLSF
jgi:hypothetical protein